MLSQRVTSTGLQDYDRVRFATQGLSLQIAEERPLGIGPGQAEEVLGYATHSMYLRILSENGITALLALLVFIGATMARALTVVRRGENQWFRELNLAVLACVAGHLINSIFIDTVHWRHIWFIYALPWAPARLRVSAWRSRLPLRRLAVVSASRTYKG
jgi:O-antigen ligase